MVQLELFFAEDWKVTSYGDESTRQLFGGEPASVLDLLCDPKDRLDLQQAVFQLTPSTATAETRTITAPFSTVNMTFVMAKQEDDGVDRSPLSIPHASPVRKGLHSGSPDLVTCFCSISKNDDGGGFVLNGMEYARKHREELVGLEFEAWLVHNCVEQAVIAARPTGDIVFWNKHAERLYQWTEEEALARNVAMLAAPDARQQQKEEIEEMEKGNHKERFIKHQRKDKSSFMAYVTDAAIMNTNDQLEYMVGISSDQQELVDVNSELETLNTDLNITVDKRLAQLIQAEKVARTKAEEAAAAESRSEVAFQTMSMLSHELRTPLQGIMGITSMALFEHDKAEEIPIIKTKVVRRDSSESSTTASTATMGSKDSVYDNLCTIQASSQLLLTLINNILDLRKMGLGMMESCKLEPVNLPSVIRECVASVKPLANLSSVGLHIGPGVSDDSPAMALGNQLQAQQVMINLLGNAIKYSSSSLKLGSAPTSVDINIRPSIIGEARREALYALCSSLDSESEETPNDMEDKLPVLIVDVRDRGDGIPPEEASKVFGAFMMLQKHAGKGNGFAQPTGSGLGLNLCTSMVAQMRGCLWANNCESPLAKPVLVEMGQKGEEKELLDQDGCVFSFYIVAAEKPVAGPSSVRSNAGASDSEADSSILPTSEFVEIPRFHTFKRSDISSIKVFLVDDAIINVKVLTRMLHSVGIRNVRSTTSSVRALKMLDEDDECDLILTDLQMPGLDGLEFAGRAHEMYTQRKKNIPYTLLCTADYSDSVSKRCFDAGLHGVLRKPITVDVLATRLLGKATVKPR